MLKKAPISSCWDVAAIGTLIRDLTVVREEMIRYDAAADRWIPEGHPARASARNLLHYAALRCHDLRAIQESLASMGLSSLGRAEAHVLHNVDCLLKILNHLLYHRWTLAPGSEDAVDLQEGLGILEQRTTDLLGPRPERRSVRIMVTMPTEAATDPDLIRTLLIGGMDCMRINCAHDGPPQWKAMIDRLAEARKGTGRPCRILMDLGGPKLRTGPLEPGPRVATWRPRRDVLGRGIAPARIWLTPAEAPEPAPSAADAVLPVPGSWLAGLEEGATLRFKDTRGKKRRLKVASRAGTGLWAESWRRCYVEPGTSLAGPGGAQVEIGTLPAKELPITLTTGDLLNLTRSQAPGRPAQKDAGGSVLEPARIPCALSEALDDVKAGESIWFDDGKIGGIVKAVDAEGVTVEIVSAGSRGEKLRSDKGINLPDTALTLSPLTEKDLEDLAFVARHADLVGYSFVRTPEDVTTLQNRLAELHAEHVGIVLKIETRSAFENLPRLLLSAMRGSAAGVMIARGDLAVECGYERLAELQEEILWMCEAAHLPAIWATQVLDTLTRDGRPSRAEVTDAAMGNRAECVMLNKGAHVVEAVRTLANILERMEGHQSKKTPLLRKLHVADGLISG